MDKRLAAGVLVFTTACATGGSREPSSSSAASGAEPHAAPVAAEVLRTVAQLRKRPECAKPGACRFLAFWDFDGTILRGDCSEGLTESDRTVYPGILEVAIGQGLSSRYRPGQFPAFWSDYKALEARNPEAAYVMLPRLFTDASEESVRGAAREHFRTTLSRHYFTSSLAMLRALESGGVENVVVSAAPQVFLAEAAETLRLPRERFHGIATAAQDGKLTDALAGEVSFGQGKVQVVLNTLSATKEAAFIVAGFGNSYRGDAPFMAFIAEQRLPAGQPVTVMINGNEAEAGPYTGMFRAVTQSLTGP